MNGRPIDLDVVLRFRPFFLPAFVDWLASNWPVYDAFERQALELIGAGWKHFSSRTIVEELRHYTRVRENGACSLKINDHLAPDLGRLFVIRWPEHAELWEYRRPDWRLFLAEIKRFNQPPTYPESKEPPIV